MSPAGRRESLPLSGRRESVGLGARPSSSDPASGRTEDSIKAIARRFDVGIVFKLSLASKGLEAIVCLENCVRLVELNLSCNAITKIENLDSLAALKRLDLSTNRISSVEGLSNLKQLETLRLEGNQIASLQSVNLPHLAGLPKLRAVYLQAPGRTASNPVCRSTAPGAYRNAVLSALPQLSNLDGERSPRTVGYGGVADAVQAGGAAPPPVPKPELPEVAAWLPAGAADADATTRPLVPPEVEAAIAGVAARVDECYALEEALKAEVAAAQRNLLGAKT